MAANDTTTNHVAVDVELKGQPSPSNEVPPPMMMQTPQPQPQMMMYPQNGMMQPQPQMMMYPQNGMQPQMVVYPQNGMMQPQQVVVVQQQTVYVDDRAFNPSHFAMGCLFGWFFGLFGLICLSMSKTSGQRKSYLAGWGTVMLVGIIVAVIYVIVYFTTVVSFR